MFCIFSDIELLSETDTNSVLRYAKLYEERTAKGAKERKKIWRSLTNKWYDTTV